MPSTTGLAPGVYVQDVRPLDRPLVSPSISNLALISQATLCPDDAPQPLWLTSFDDYLRELRGDSAFVKLIMQQNIVWTANEPSIGERFVSDVTARLKRIATVFDNEKSQKLIPEIRPLPFSGNAKQSNGEGEKTSPLPDDDAIEQALSFAGGYPDDLKEIKKLRKEAKDARTKADAARNQANEGEQALAKAMTELESASAETREAKLAACSNALAERDQRNRSANQLEGDAAKSEQEYEQFLNRMPYKVAEHESRWKTAVEPRGKPATDKAIADILGELKSHLSTLYFWTERRAQYDIKFDVDKAKNAIQGVTQAWEKLCQGKHRSALCKILGRMAITAWSVKGFFQNGGRNLTLFDVSDVKGFVGSEAKMSMLTDPRVDAGLVCAPGYTSEEVYKGLKEFCGRRDLAHSLGEPFCFAVLDAHALNGSALPQSAKDPKTAPNMEDDDSGHSSACYWPWLVVGRTESSRDPIIVPPSAFVAGVIASTDNAIGPHQAPAGDDRTVKGALALTRNLNESEHGSLNEIGINCLRTFPGGSPVVYGTRTLSKDTNCQYIPVARMLMLIRKTVKKGLRPFVFKPNTHDLRAAVYRNLYTYLEGLRRQGMLKGRKADEAFRITCNDSNNPENDQKQGRLNVRVEVAPVTPAEFVMVEVTQLQRNS